MWTPYIHKTEKGIDTYIYVYNYGTVHVGIFGTEKKALDALTAIGNWFS